MTSISTFDEFVPQLLAFITRTQNCFIPDAAADGEFNRLAASLFDLQRKTLPIYRDYCAKRKITSVSDWREIPTLPARVFKEYDVTSLPPVLRTRVFHSSGTTRQRPGRHFHSDESLTIYEASLRPWFRQHFFGPPPAPLVATLQLIVLTPTPEAAPHSSLAHMFGAVRSDFERALFTGKIAEDGAWTLDLKSTVSALRVVQEAGQPVALLGTALSFVQLLEHCRASHSTFRLPPGSRALETGGYKGRTRALPKQELRQWITRSLGLPPLYIVGEYGMSELSSQAYDRVIGETGSGLFRFPPWARAQIISPETGREAAEGETGIVRVFDLANVRSVLALQTEDLAVRHSGGFELAGRVAEAEMRGCSLLQQEL